VSAAGGSACIKRTGEACGGGSRGKRTGTGDGVAQIKRTMKTGTDGNEWGWQDYRGRKKAGREDRRLENKRRDPGSMEMKTLIQEGWKMNDRISASPGSGSAAGFGMAG